MLERKGGERGRKGEGAGKVKWKGEGGRWKGGRERGKRGGIWRGERKKRRDMERREEKEEEDGGERGKRGGIGRGERRVREESGETGRESK